MPLTVSCEACQKRMEVHDHAAGTVVRCRTCGELIQVPGGLDKICVNCGGNLSMQKRVRDQDGNYWCHPCWDAHYRQMADEQSQEQWVGTNEDSGEEVLEETMEAEPAIDEMEAPQEDGGYCSRCRHGYAYTDMYNLGGKHVCKRCVHSSVGRWGFRVVAAAVAVAIVWTAITVVVPAMKNRGKDPLAIDGSAKDATKPKVEPPRTTTNTNNGTGGNNTAVNPPPRTAVQSGPSAAELEQNLRRNFNAAAGAAVIGARDYGKLLTLAKERQEMLRSAPRGVSTLIDQWLDDADVIRQARQHVSRTRYADAVALLRERIVARYGPLAPVPAGAQAPTGRAPDFINGELGIAMVEAALAAVVVDDKWLLDRKEMSALLRVVGERDPASVKALVMQGWLVYADPQEELQRLDARPSVLDRNRLLLPIRTSLTSSITGYEQLTEFEYFQQKLDALPNGIPAKAFREVMSPLDYSLGLSRRRIEEEYLTWTENLATPSLVLKDKANYTYAIIEGYLWKQVPREDGGFEWQLMVPPGPGSRPGEKWTPYTVRLLQHRGPDANVPQHLAELASRLERAKQLPVAMPRINGYTLAAFDWQNLSPARLFELKLPLFFTTIDQVKQAFTASGRLGGAGGVGGDAGRKLFVDHRTGEEFFKKSMGAQPLAQGALQYVSLPVPPMMAVLERQEPVEVELFETTGGLPHFISSTGLLVHMKEGYTLGLTTPGGSSVNILIYGSHFNRDEVRDAVARILKQAKSDTGWGAVTELRNLIRESGNMGQQSLDELLVDAIAPPPGAANPMVIQRGPGVRDAWWSVAANYNDLVREARLLFCRYPYGINRNRLVRDRITGVAAANTPVSEERWRDVRAELQFLDGNGDPVMQFYTLEEFKKLMEDTQRDFTRPSNRMVPSPFIAEQPGVFDERLQAFLMEQAEKFRTEGEYHRASAFYRELRLPPFALQAFDATKPRNRQEFDELLRDITKRAASGRQKLESRLAHAQVLMAAGRQQLADALIETAKAEWAISGLPLLDDLRRYSEAYGYAPNQEFDRAYADIRVRVGDLAGGMGGPGQPRPDAPKFDPAKAGADGNAYLDSFYDGKPSFDEYRKAKQWALANDRRLLMRRPRSNASAHLLFWSPLTTRPDPRVKAGERPETTGPRQLSAEEVFGATGGGATTPDPLAEHWLRTLYAVETGDPSDYSEARRLLIYLASAQRRSAGEVPSASSQAQCHALNAIATITLANLLDANLPVGFGTARFDSFVLESGDLELQTFVRPRLVASGLSVIEIADLVDPVTAMIAAARGQQVQYADLRYYWTEYAPVVDDYRQFRKGVATR